MAIAVLKRALERLRDLADGELDNIAADLRELVNGGRRRLAHGHIRWRVAGPEMDVPPAAIKRRQHA